MVNAHGSGGQTRRLALERARFSSGARRKVHSGFATPKRRRSLDTRTHKNHLFRAVVQPLCQWRIAVAVDAELGTRKQEPADVTSTGPERAGISSFSRNFNQTPTIMTTAIHYVNRTNRARTKPFISPQRL